MHPVSKIQKVKANLTNKLRWMKTALDGVFSQIKIDLPADGICLASGSVTPSSARDGYISSVGD